MTASSSIMAAASSTVTVIVILIMTVTETATVPTTATATFHWHPPRPTATVIIVFTIVIPSEERLAVGPFAASVCGVTVIVPVAAQLSTHMTWLRSIRMKRRIKVPTGLVVFQLVFSPNEPVVLGTSEKFRVCFGKDGKEYAAKGAGEALVVLLNHLVVVFLVDIDVHPTLETFLPVDLARRSACRPLLCDLQG